MPPHYERTESARILIIDDEPANIKFLEHVLRREPSFEVMGFSQGSVALERFEELAPDLVILDLRMPEMDGFQVMEALRERTAGAAPVPVLVATADPSVDLQRRALAGGASDFLTKPLSPSEVRLRVRNLLEMRFLQQQLHQNNALLEERVVERTQELEQARLEILARLGRAAEYRDDQTGQHTVRVGRLAARMASILGLAEERVELIRRAAPLHDIGKIGIPDGILLKPDRLTAEEAASMRTHTTIGADILSGSRSPLLRLAEEIALTHHERWDGAGYPRGLAAEDIPLPGRIVAVADVFDSLTHERPYKSAWTVRDALIEIEDSAGSHLDPSVVEALLRIAPEAGVLARTVRGSRPVRWAAGINVDGAPGVVPGPAAADHDRLAELESEREALAREVRNLKRRIARRDRKIDRLEREFQPR